jgi:hypothetical protein
VCNGMSIGDVVRAIVEHWMRMGGLVVDDGVDRLSTGTCLSMTLSKRMNSRWQWRCMLRHRGEQRRRAVPLIIVRHGPGATLLLRQPGLCAVKRLNLALCVD